MKVLNKLVAYIAAITAIGTAISAIASDKPKEPYPHLNSWGEKPAICDLKPEDAEWLEKHIAAGNVRVATMGDVNAWEAMAGAKGWDKPMADCGRTFVILKEIVIDRSEAALGHVTFIVAADAPFPEIKKIYVPFYDLKTGSAFQMAHCFLGKEEWICRSPRDSK